MPDADSIKPDEETYWTFRQVLGWVGWRDPDRVNTAYREWRDRHYKPRISDWTSKDPLIWEWRSPVDELDEATQALRRKCEAGALHGTGREGVGGPRCEIALLRWPDLMLVDIAGTTAGPQLYDSSAPQLAIMDGRAKPAIYNPRFAAAAAVKAFPASAEQPATAHAPEPITPGPGSRSRRLPLDEVVAALLRIVSKGREARETHDVLIQRLRGEEGVLTSPATLKRAIKKAGIGWR